MLSISPQYLPLSKLFVGRLFRIPEFQRAYSWTSRQRRDLFGDIRKIHSKGADESHFMAAVVCLRRETQRLGTDDFDVLDVVDGQQRLTTLIILMNTIRLSLSKTEESQKKLSNELASLLVKEEGDELLLLQTNHDSSHHFTNFLRKGEAPSSDTANTSADLEVLRAVEDCRNFVDEWVQKGLSLPDLVAILKNRLYFLLHEIDDEKSVYTVFEVLNSRGLDVSWLDRLKSILMGMAFEMKKNANKVGVIADLHKHWRDIYAAIGLRETMSREVLRFAATLKNGDAPSRPLGEQDSVELLRSLATDASLIRQVASWVLAVTKACHTVTSNPRINAVTRISQARLLATAICLRNDITIAQRKKLLDHWEKVTFRIYGMLGNDARVRVGDYVRLAWRVVNEKLSVEDIGLAIGEIGSEFPIERAVEALAKANCYEGWESELRYFMFRYEEHLCHKMGLNFKNEQWAKVWMVSPSDSIEHIWPKSKAKVNSKHRIGNLVLLSPNLNSKLQDISPKAKADAYRQTGLLIAGEVANTIEASGWNAKSIAAREKVLLEWASAEWAD
jgi:hypothetical protein